jgi:hypothetical protein
MYFKKTITAVSVALTTVTANEPTGDDLNKKDVVSRAFFPSASSAGPDKISFDPKLPRHVSPSLDPVDGKPMDPIGDSPLKTSAYRSGSR